MRKSTAGCYDLYPAFGLSPAKCYNCVLCISGSRGPAIWMFGFVIARIPGNISESEQMRFVTTGVVFPCKWERNEIQRLSDSSGSDYLDPV